MKVNHRNWKIIGNVRVRVIYLMRFHSTNQINKSFQVDYRSTPSMLPLTLLLLLREGKNYNFMIITPKN